MTARAHIMVIVITILVALVTLRLVRLQQLRSKYGLLWLTITILMLPLAAWPAMLNTISRWVGVHYAPTTFLLFGVGFLFAVAVHFSWELSRLEIRSRTLAEEIALLRAALEAGEFAAERTTDADG